jgi:hypothetical protein
MIATVVALLLFMAGWVLLIHHGYHHMNDPPDSRAKDESVPAVCYFQISDISNHETWILVCWTNALTIVLTCLI